MKKISLIVMLALVCNFAMAQIQPTSYRGAFAPAPTPMWTNGWTNFDPLQTAYSTAARTRVTADILSNTTWTNDKVYELGGLITVRNNATLTIQAGTVIRSNAASSALIITRGAKLNANGTLANPIVFTSANAPGQRNRGDWGGIVILGKARYNLSNGENFIEGLSQNSNTQFGGGLSPDDNDNSGILRFVRIEFAGYVFAPNNELNGLTLGAVGRGTVIENVQVSYSNDDSFEWFGGSVNCKNLVAFAGLDDDWDVDSGYKGTVQFGLSIKDPLAADISTSEAFEVDNNASGSDTTGATATYGDYTSPIFSNMTCIGANKRPNGTSGFVSPNNLHDKALRLRRASQPKIFNSIFLDFKLGLVIESQSSNASAIAGRLKFENNIIVSPTPFRSVNDALNPFLPSSATVDAWFATTNNTTRTDNTGILEMPYSATSATDYVGLDYRPVVGGVAASGASFTDPLLDNLIVKTAAPGVVTPLRYCKGAVAPALNANLTGTGVSLRWYTKDRTFKAAVGSNPPVQVVDVFTTTNPIPTTSTIGTKAFWVAEIDANGVESLRTKIDVTIVASPIVGLGTITSPDGTAAVSKIGALIGSIPNVPQPTAAYSVPVSTEVGIASYLWSVPLGTTILSGQGTNSIVVDFANVASGLFKVGNIGVQAVNAAGCAGKMKTLALTSALPKAPATLVMNDAQIPASSTGIAPAVRSFAKYMGTTTPLTLNAAVASDAKFYVWELPTGVNLMNLGTVVSTVPLFYSVFPFTVPHSRPTSVGNQYFQVIVTSYSSGIRISQASKFIVGGRLASGVLVAPVGGFMATSSSNATPTTNQDGSVGVFRANAVGVPFTQVNGVTVDPAFPITVSALPSITVNFAGVTTANTIAGTSTSGVATNTLRVGVRSINGVGVSLTSNATAIPATSSAAKLLTLTAVVPAAVKTVTGQIAALCGGTSYNYTITPSPLASSYTITAPAGSVVTSASMMSNTTNTLATSDLAFTVMYPAGFVATTAAPQSLLVSAVNGMGSSLLPATVRLSTLMSAIGTFTGSAGITTFTRVASQTFTVPAVLGATNYVWTLANGATGTSTTNTITVDFSAVPSTVTSTKITVVAQNACGASSAAKSISLRSVVPTPRLAAVAVTATEVYPNPVLSVFNVDVTASKAGVLDIAIYSLDGTVVVNAKSITLKEGVNTITENVSSLNKGIYIVRLVNSSNGEVITKKLIKN